MTSSADAKADLLCGRYLLTAIERSGAQAVVTKAYDTLGAREVAIKRMLVGGDAAKSSEGFNRETQALLDLKHPNIVDLIEVGRDDNGWFLALEWLPDNLEQVIEETGSMSWARFWDRIGNPLLGAIVYAQGRRVAHRDIKPQNILVGTNGVPKLADYGIAKLVEIGKAWSVAGLTLRFQHTPGYTPASLEDPIYDYAKDCFAFAAVAVSCLVGRLFRSDEELKTALNEAVMPARIRSILESCISNNPAERPQMASVLQARLEEALAEDAGASDAVINLVMTNPVRSRLQRILEFEFPEMAEAFVLDELSEQCALVSGGFNPQHQEALQLIGVTWAFEVQSDGRHNEALKLVGANEVGAALAAALRDAAPRQRYVPTFELPTDKERTGQLLAMFIAEARSHQAVLNRERLALEQERVFKVWRNYLRDRADLEAQRKNAIRYVNRHATRDRIVFTTELAKSDEIVGQERVVSFPGGRVTGKISAAAFNLITMEVAFGDSSKTPRRGEIAINTIAAERALDAQRLALDAVIYERAVNPRLKQIILSPETAAPPTPLTELELTDSAIDPEKIGILKRALGLKEIMAIEGPPGTGKTKLITEIVVQWLARNPKHRILISSQTHIALDNVIEHVAGAAPHLDIIRIGNPDEPRISEFGKTLLLGKRVENWIAEVRAATEVDMTRWADAHGVDRDSIALGMKVERLIQILKRKKDIKTYITDKLTEHASLESAREVEEGTTTTEEAEEQTTELESEIGSYRRALTSLRGEEKATREQMKTMGEYASELSDSDDISELSEWSNHLLPSGPLTEQCRARLELLEFWHLRLGRSPDFTAAMLSSAQVIAGTCVGIAGVRGMQQVEYDVCIVDEASKATPTEILIPMSRSRRWILVGDPKQLPPFFEEFGNELKSEFGEDELRSTLLDRLLAPPRPLPVDCRAQLKNQYRMITAIGDLVSTCFYGGRLVSPIKNHDLKLGAILPKPVLWRSTHLLPHHGEKRQDQTFRNPAEVTAVRDVLKRIQFISRAQKRRISVAVIAGYTGQVAALKEMISQGVAEWSAMDIECNTVDAFQGREADICIYSVVRSNAQFGLGFLREPTRLNVALSRGKSALIIIGDFPFCRNVQGQNPFKQVTRYIEEHEDDCMLESIQ